MSAGRIPEHLRARMTPPPQTRPVPPRPRLRVPVTGESLEDCAVKAEAWAMQFFGDEHFDLALLDAELGEIVSTGTGASSYVTYNCEFVAWAVPDPNDL